MFRWLPLFLRLPLVLLIIVANVILCCLFVYIFAFVKAIVRIRPVTRGCSHILANIAAFWIGVNSWTWRNFYSVTWDVQFRCEIDPNKSYCVVVNHQSWVDIITLQYVLNLRVPFMRFFIKKQLMWLPLLGIAWWALDFPFMSRYSAKYLMKNPHMKGKDIETAKKSCEKFREFPTSILIFAEGTRITDEKHAKSNYEYKHLLPAKSGGLHTILSVMGDQLDSMLDISIVYSGRRTRPSMADLLTDKMDHVMFLVEKREIPDEFRQSPSYPGVKTWLKQVWAEKDQTIEEAQRQPS